MKVVTFREGARRQAPTHPCGGAKVVMRTGRISIFMLIIFLNPPTTLSKIPIVLPGTLLLLVDAVGWKISGLKLLFFGSLLMFCCCSFNLKDEAIQVMECHKVRHSLGSTLIRPVNPRIIKPSMQSSVSIFAQKYLCSKVSSQILISSYKIIIFAFMKIVLEDDNAFRSALLYLPFFTEIIMKKPA